MIHTVPTKKEVYFLNFLIHLVEWYEIKDLIPLFKSFPKPIRILMYFLLKNNNILKDTLYSNLFYHENQDLSYDNMMLSYFGDEIKNIISVRNISKRIHLEDFPIILDTIWGKTEPFQNYHLYIYQ